MTRVQRPLVPPLLLATAAFTCAACVACVCIGARQALAAPPAPAAPATATSQRSPADATHGVVLLISERADDVFLARIKAELVASGFTTVVRRSEVPLEQAARELNALAAIRILPSRQGVEVWMADRTSGRSLLRQVIVDENPAGPNQSVVALQTAELLRTSLLAPPPQTQTQTQTQTPAQSQIQTQTQTQAQTQTTQTQIARSDEVAQERRANKLPSAGIQAALGALYSPGAGAGTAFQLWLSLQRALSQHVALALDLSASLHDASLDSVEGTTRIGTYLAGVAFVLQTRSAHGRFFLDGGAGLGAMRINFDSDPAPPLLSHSSAVTTATAYLRTDLGVELVPWLRLGARATAGLAFNRVDITLAGNQAGSWGPFYTGAFILAEVPWR